MIKPIPQEAIDSLPDGYTLLGWGGEFETKGLFYGLALDSDYSDSTWTLLKEWHGTVDNALYAAPHDSEIVELNRKHGRLPEVIYDQIENGHHLFKSEDFLSEKDGSISDKKPLPTDSAERKTYPMYSGLLAYFPHALAAVSNQSYRGNLQHHPDKPLHWDMDKSTDELDALMRHVVDEDWVHVAWRALANLERKLTGKCTYENK